jgi:alanine-glyoxylate transaminase/serine-glyoxylate transaminase/serine-pyruvate transaminase
MVDAISSLGGVDLRMDDWGIDLCVSASQKALEGPPGLALVAVGDRIQSRVSAAAPGSWYLGIGVWKEYAEAWGDWHPYPITMAVPAFRALRVGLERVLDEGLQHRIGRHRESFVSVRRALAGLGFEPVFPEHHATPTILAAYGSPTIGADDVVARLKHEHRILIARGMGQFAGKAFRIGNMGRQATPAEMTPLLDAIGSLARNGKGKDEQS